MRVTAVEEKHMVLKGLGWGIWLDLEDFLGKEQLR